MREITFYRHVLLELFTGELPEGLVVPEEAKNVFELFQAVEAAFQANPNDQALARLREAVLEHSNAAIYVVDKEPKEPTL